MLSHLLPLPSQNPLLFPSSRCRFGLRLLVALLLLLLAAPANAQIQLGQIQGLVTKKEDGQPLAGVTVVVTGPALQADQTEVTDVHGRYQITQLPSGDNYLVRFYFADLVIERPGIRIAQNKTLTVSVEISQRQAVKEVQVIRERAPSIDTATTSVGLEINEEVLTRAAVHGRTYESVLQLAPGSIDAPRGVGGDVGVSLSGSTGTENVFLIDGLNTSDPNSGLLATELHQNFIKEINVINGGYQAEYGRATGGIVSIVTKSGSNEFHGSVFGSIQPFQLQPTTVARLGESLGLRTRPDALTYDVGFELGGAIVKDRLWFFVGFAPTTTTFQHERVVRQLRIDSGGNPIRQPCTKLDYLAIDPCRPGGAGLATDTDELTDRAQHFSETKRLYNGIVRLQINLNKDHSLTLGYTAAPSTYDGYNTFRPFYYSRTGDFALQQTDQVHDATLRYGGKLFAHRLQLEVLYGFHYQSQEMRPTVPDQPEYVYYTDASNPYSLADFENIPECRRLANGTNPCPLTTYYQGGFGEYGQTVLQRHQALSGATLYLTAKDRRNPLQGTHALKVGVDFEYLSNDHTRILSGADASPNDPYAGHQIWQTSADGTQIRNAFQFATRGPDGSLIPVDRYNSRTSTRNYTVYLRDSWTVGWLPGLVLNAGLRWEGQELLDQNGQVGIRILDNLSPRIGAVWDFTRQGRSKLFVNYGRFYEALPLAINDRDFSGEGNYTGPFASDCPRMAMQPGGRLVPVVNGSAPCSVNGPGEFAGGSSVRVMPGLKGQYLDEVALGVQYEVGLGIVLGIGYTYRTLGNVIEDMSPDSGGSFVIANPGVAVNPAVVTDLQQRIASLQRSNTADSLAEAARLQGDLSAYQFVSSAYSRAQRDYHALTLTAQKRLSHRFSALASYTYSRTIGNYPGTYDAHSDDIHPNASAQFDLPDFQTNRRGPLPTDRPHNFKLFGTYEQPLTKSDQLVFSLTFMAYSGRPINVLGAHPFYNNGAVFILPRGSGGRTPTITQLDLHVGYERKLPRSMTLTIAADIINLLNQQAVTNVDDDYTLSIVQPILNGQPSDLQHLKTMDGGKPVVNPNYGNATAYQAPLYMRFGARLAF